MLYQLLLIALIMVISCDNDPKIAAYFERPYFEECVSNGDGTMFCNGEEVSTAGSTCTRDSKQIKRYYNDKEKRLYICLKYPRRCR